MSNFNTRETLISVFEDTLKQCKENEELKKLIEKSIENQRFISAEAHIEVSQEPVYEKDAVIVVSKKRSLEAAMGYQNKKICVHNFASATHPGGGVTRGSGAQEECICRCSTLYPCLNDPEIMRKFYRTHSVGLRAGTMERIYNDDCIYTPGVMVLKSDTKVPTSLLEKDRYMIDVITCAAPNLRPFEGQKPLKISDKELMEVHEKRATRILEIAKTNGVEVVALGAFGCGAFQNPPRVVAEGIARAVKKFIKDFEVIEFAVYCPPGDTTNYDTFKRRFGG